LSIAERINAESVAKARLALAKPFVWMHVPKVGTTMVNIFYNHPGICPLAPDGIRMPENSTTPDTDLFIMYPPLKFCLRGFPVSFPLEVQAQHLPYEQRFPRWQGHIVAMFRQPEQRLMSDYYDSNWRQYHAWWYTFPPPRDAHHFAVELQGCVTKTLARKTDEEKNPCLGPHSPPPTKSESALALWRLREGFAFVGIQEKWALSVCLFHAKFAGDCKAAELSGARLGYRRNSTKTGYDLTPLRGFRDKSDGRLYVQARRIFFADLRRFGVSAEKCAEWCWPPTVEPSTEEAATEETATEEPQTEER